MNKKEEKKKTDCVLPSFASYAHFNCLIVILWEEQLPNKTLLPPANSTIHLSTPVQDNYAKLDVLPYLVNNGGVAS